MTGDLHDPDDLPYPIPEKADIIGVLERQEDECVSCGCSGPWIWVIVGGPGSPDYWRGLLCGDCFGGSVEDADRKPEKPTGVTS